MRLSHKGRKEQKRFLPIIEAREKKLKIDWSKPVITKPSFTGNKVFNNFPLEKIKERIDWTPFFITWELKGKYPRIFDDPTYGREARKLYDDANKLLEEVIKNKWLSANAVIGLYPANSVSDDVELYTNDKRNEVLITFHMLRQQAQKTIEQPYLSLADFVAPKESGIKDYFGCFAVTAGIGIEAVLERFKKQHDDYNSILLKALADRLAEAFAELMHELVRKELWGYAKSEDLSNDQLIKEEYTGIRPAPGYPAQPDHSEKRILFDLLDAEDNAGIVLTESFAMYPASSVCGLYIAHSDSKYFNVGKIDKDQVEEYAKRKRMSVEEAERWLMPILGYEMIEEVES
jgi:5-methyltetrahydrofolate--homocysteine methyltransferase